MRFGKSILYRCDSSFFEKFRFFCYGHDFVGAAIRLSHFKKTLSFLQKNVKNVLDAGCGTGDFSFYIAEKYPSAHVFAYDISIKTLEMNMEIQKKIGFTNITFSPVDLLHLSEKEEYDFIYSIGTLIYFSKQDTLKILKNLTNALQPSAYLYLDLPQRDFSEISWLPSSWYPKQYAALQKENAGDLYSYEEMQKILTDLGYEIISTTKSFSYFGKLGWEFDNYFKEKNMYRLRYYIFLPFLKLLASLDAITKHKKGCCFVILARKRS